MNIKTRIVLLACLTYFRIAAAQNYTQTIRGVVVDKVLQMPIAGATVAVVGSPQGVVTDTAGNFVLVDMPVATYALIVTAVGFKDHVVSNITINTGKEVVLTIMLDEKILQGREIVVKGNRKKNIPLNQMSVVSARSFSVEETQKYAAAVNDPARMAANFAGVMAGDDGNNQIVIRGNSPSGLLWRMEGIDVPNPNHFASAGSSGGGISILSTQLLSNSDFVTGAFAAEYGNAMSGVFDLKLRKGNNQQREYTAQAGILGLNLAAEGPFVKNYKGSYLFNYRYSTLSVLSKLGFSFTPSTTNFQDLSYHFYLPTKRFGDFSLFSFGGLSKQFYDVVKDSTKWKSEGDKYGDQFISNTGLWGATHQVHTGRNQLLKTALAYSVMNSSYNRDYVQENYSMLNVYDQKSVTKKLTFSSVLNQRFNSRMMLRSGVIASHIQFDFAEQIREKKSDPLKELVNVSASTQTIQLFSQLQYKLSGKLVFTGGLHYLLLLLNQTNSLEPRASLKWDIHPRHSLAFGYGKHSQLQGWGVYFANRLNASGQKILPNRDLNFSKANHYVLSHHFSISKSLLIKTEIYYQYLYHIPVSIYDTSTLSAINTQADFIRDEMVNQGKGKNYGIEISVEKQLSRNFYYMFSTSLYQSKYTAANGKEYNTKFNGNQIFNLTAGKDFVSASERRTFGINIKSVYAGGYRTTPIDLEQSVAKETTVYIQDKAYTSQLPAYFRSDIRLSMKWNRKHLTSTLSLDIQNMTNRQNVYDQFYDVDTRAVKTYYQTGLLPILNYKVEF
ncbi:MAG: TonB-dependent receptor [Chitinophagaceae bacterium]|nr:TonB-dependent receptor [Chitinophagaceae bacterium]